MPRHKSTHVDSAAAVGQRVREARERRGLRQRDLAFEGCSAAYVSRIEAGKRIPSLQLIEEFARRLAVSSGYLARGEDASARAVVVADAQLAQRLGEVDEARRAYAGLAKSDDPVTQRAAMLGLGQLELAGGDVQKAIDLLERAVEVEGDDPFGDVAAAEALARAYETRGDLSSAIALLERKIAANGEDPVAHFRLAVLLATALIDVGEFGRAESVLGEATGALGVTSTPTALARSLWAQARLQTARGESDLALHYAEEALALLDASEQEEYAARAQQLIAHLEIERGEAAHALEVIDSALPLVTHGRDQELLAVFRAERAWALTALGRLDEARLLAAEAVGEVDQISKADAARTLSTLAEVFAAAGDTEQAISMFEAAANELAGRESGPMLVSVYSRWSELLEESGETERALDVARKALRVTSSGLGGWGAGMALQLHRAAS